MKLSIHISTVSVLFALLITGGMPRANAQEQKSGNDSMTESLQRLKGKEFEAGFLNQMIQHHQGAIEMAKMVPSHTSRPELNEYAKKIISAQDKEIGEMTRWLKEWQGTEPEKMPNMIAGKKMKAEMPMLLSRAGKGENPRL
jgi:predicted outer membrane protein